MNTTVRKLVVASSLTFATAFAQAAPVQSSWDFRIDAKWIDATFSTESHGLTKEQGFSSQVIQWGTEQQKFNGKPIDYRNPENAAYARSALEIPGSPVVGSINTGSTNATLFTHYNSEISYWYHSLERATLQVNLEVLLPNGTKVDTLTQEFQVYFKETLNTGASNCAWGLCDNDIFAIVAPSPSSSFTYDGQEYTLNYFDNANTPLTNSVCSTFGVASNAACYGFSTPEKSITQVQFALSISPVSAVPEPESYAMLLAGLGIVGAVARRRRNMR